jgi:hypothetical protein
MVCLSRIPEFGHLADFGETHEDRRIKRASRKNHTQGAIKMRRLSLIGLALIAVLALGAFAASTAFALPELLPHGSWTGKDDGGAAKPTLEISGSTNIVICESGATANGADETDTLGLFHIDFLGCVIKGTAVKCESASDTAGTILLLGTYHYVFDTLGAGESLGVAILFLPEHLHFTCLTPFVNTLILVLGPGPICLILKPLESNLTHLFHCEQEKGIQKERTYWNDEGKEVKASLKCSVNEGAEGECAELALAEVKYAVAQAFMNH